MNLSLDATAQKLITDRVQSSKYAKPEDVVTAAVQSLAQDETTGDFAPGEFDDLIEEGENSGPALDGPSVLAELRKLRAQSAGKSK